jgi:hypothetical protein
VIPFTTTDSDLVGPRCGASFRHGFKKRRYAIERELGDEAGMNRRAMPLIVGSLLLPLGC